MDTSFLTFSMSPLEIFVRGSLMYWFLFLIFRFVLRRSAGSAGIADILFVVVLGDAAQNAMIGNGDTVPDGASLIATLVLWNYLLDYLGSHFRIIEKLTSPPPVRLVRNGRLLLRNLRQEHVSEEELNAKVRGAGVQGYEELKAVYLENDGSFSVLKRKTSG